jgi:DNA repair exonuclease SbcCD ATPase subunit
MNEELLKIAINDEEKIRRNLNYSLNMLEIGAGLAAFVKDCSNQKNELNDKIELSKIKIEALEKQIAKEPIKESLADRGCPVCGAYISYDALNEDIKEAPKFCTECGCKFDWSDEE